jgi:hypothetical protein
MERGNIFWQWMVLQVFSGCPYCGIKIADVLDNKIGLGWPLEAQVDIGLVPAEVVL